jgi:hypothetical protein
MLLPYKIKKGSVKTLPVAMLIKQLYLLKEETGLINRPVSYLLESMEYPKILLKLIYHLQ